MRLRIAALLLGATSLSLAACDSQAPETKAKSAAPVVVETPKRKPGLWKQVMTIQDIGASQTASLCLDKDTDAKLSWWAQQGVRGGCAKNDVAKQPDGSWAFSSSCEMVGGIQMTTEGSATGDFQTNYTVTARTTTTGAPMQQMNGTRTTVIEATWVGECPAGMKPGEMELPGGQRVDMMAMAAEGAGQP